MAKNKYSSSQLAKRKRRQKNFRIILIGTFLITIFAGSCFWLNHPFFNISAHKISPTEFANSEIITEKVEQILSEKVFFLLSSKNIFLIPKTKIREVIIQSDYAVKDVSLKVSNFDLLEINISEHSVVAKWCGPDFQKEISECYLLNEEGQIFTQEKVLDKKKTLKFFSQFEEQNILGYQYLSEEIFGNVINFSKYLPEFNIHVKHIEIENNETFLIKSIEGPVLMIGYQNSAEETLNNLKTVIETEEINQAQFANLEYIDLRFGNKVYYKIK